MIPCGEAAIVTTMKTGHPHKPGAKPKIAQRKSLPDFLSTTLLYTKSSVPNPNPRQRAFRERKELHVKNLEAKLAALEKNSATVVEENERLKLQLQKAATENEILKATAAYPHRGGSEPLPNAGPMRYSPTDFYTEVLQAHDNKTPSHRIVTSDTGERLLAAGATWDYIIKHPLYIRGLVDVGDVSERLKKKAKCDGQGPVFEEREIIDAIEKSVASGSDELL
jgi:AP-1-like factor